MEIDIILYNRKLITIAKLLTLVGLLLLCTFLIPTVGENYGRLISCIILIFFFAGIIAVNYSTSNTTKIGRIVIEPNTTRILANSQIIELSNKDYKVHFSRKGFKGQSNYSPFTNVGALTMQSGINTLTFFNDSNSYKNQILIESESDYTKLKEILSKNYMK